MQRGGNKVCLVPSGERQEGGRSLDTQQQNALKEELRLVLPTESRAVVLCAESASAMLLAKSLAKEFADKEAPCSCLNDWSDTPPGQVDAALERLRSNAEAVVAVADERVLRELARYYIEKSRGVRFPVKVPPFTFGQVMAIDLRTGVFQIKP